MSSPELWLDTLNIYKDNLEAVEAFLADARAMGDGRLNVVLTGAGATYPYQNDPTDSNLRIAPSLPPVEELEKAMEVLTTSVKLAALEKLMKE